MKKYNKNKHRKVPMHFDNKETSFADTTPLLDDVISLDDNVSLVDSDEINNLR